TAGGVTGVTGLEAAVRPDGEVEFSDDPLDGLLALAVAPELGAVPGLPVVPRAVVLGGWLGPGVLSRGATGPGGRDWTVLLGPPHGPKRAPSHVATDGPARSSRATTTPAPSAMRNHRAVKMLVRRRMRCDTSDLTRLILEFPKYGRMLGSRC